METIKFVKNSGYGSSYGSGEGYGYGSGYKTDTKILKAI
jgi:hypothetical protein